MAKTTRKVLAMETVTDDAQLIVTPLGKAVKAYLEYCASSRQLAKGTVALYRCVLDVMVEVCGPELPVHTLNAQHIAWTLDKARKGDTPAEAVARTTKRPSAHQRRPRGPGAINVNISVYKTFAQYCQQMRWLSPYRDPCVGVRPTKTAVVRQNWVKWTVPVGDRAILLEMAGKVHPRDRFVVAMGLFGGRRTSDVRDMRVKDIDLDQETFTFTNEKAGGLTRTLPVLWPEFMTEIRLWLAWYASQHGLLDPDWYLIPKRAASYEYWRKEGRPAMDPSWPVNPTEAAWNTGEKVKVALELIGAPVERGGFGMHVLRHSCAVWLLDHLKWDIYDVATWLDHSNVEITKNVYLRGASDVKRLRDKYQNGHVPTDGHGPMHAMTAQRLQNLAYAE